MKPLRNGHANGHGPRFAVPFPEERLPPQNVEAEEAVLGAILLDDSVIPAVLQILAPEHFWRDDHQLIYRAIRDLHDQGKPVDALMLDDELRRRGVSERIGGPDAIAAMVNRVAHAANVLYHAEIVRQLAIKRAVARDCREILDRSYDPATPAFELADELTRAGEGLAEISGRASEEEAETVCLADVQPEEIRFLWPGKIPRGMISALVGDPGLGKSFITQGLAATISVGAAWPDGGNADLGSTVFLSAEDSLRQTIRPRLDAAGADVRKIHALTMVKGRGGRKRSFTLANDLPALDRLLGRLADVRLVVIDPINAYLGGADGHKDSDIRGMLAPLKEIAERRDCAVLIVMHMNKSGGNKAMYRGNGSLAFIASARVAWLVTPDQADRSRRLILPIKANVIPGPAGIAYRIGDRGIEYDPAPIATTADEALAEEGRGQARGQGAARRGPLPVETQRAMAWARQQLERGPVLHGRLRQAAEALDPPISTATFYRALDEISAVKFEETEGNKTRKWVRLSAADQADADRRRAEADAEPPPETIPFPDPPF